jgi:hypothetical protein
MSAAISSTRWDRDRARRAFRAGEIVRAPETVAVLGAALWESRYGADATSS